MKLSNADFKRWKDLQAKLKSGKITDVEKEEFAKLTAMRASKGDNDVAWWLVYKELINDTANFPFSLIKGANEFDFPKLRLSHDESGKETFAYNAGIRIDYLRTPGKIKNANSAFNYQMRAMWLQMHRKYRGLGAYEFADLGMVIWAEINAFADIARAERIYGVLMHYNAKNRTYPDNLLTAMGIDGRVTGDDLAQLRYAINRIVTRAKNLLLPKGLSILASFIEMDSNVFKDGDSDRSDWYVYDTREYWKYNPSIMQSGGCCEIVNRSRTGTGGLQSVSDIITDLNDQFDALLLDTDVARVCSDLLACYGESGTVTLQYLPENYELVPVKNDTRNLQLMNTTIVGAVCGADILNSVWSDFGIDENTTPAEARRKSLRLYQDGGICYFDLASVCDTVDLFYSDVLNPTQDGGANGNWFLSSGETSGSRWRFSVTDANFANIWNDSVSLEDKVELTRQMVAKGSAHFSVNSKERYFFFIPCEAFGHVVVEQVAIYGNESVPGYEDHILYTDVAASVKEITAAVQLSMIDYHMPVVVQSHDVDASQLAILSDPYWLWEVDNYTKVSSDTLKNLHDVAMLSGFKFADAGVNAK